VATGPLLTNAEAEHGQRVWIVVAEAGGERQAGAAHDTLEHWYEAAAGQWPEREARRDGIVIARLLPLELP
jgi:hypothetical protein